MATLNVSPTTICVLAGGTGSTTITWDTGGPLGRVKGQYIPGGGEFDIDPPNKNDPAKISGIATLSMGVDQTALITLKNDAGTAVLAGPVTVKSMVCTPPPGFGGGGFTNTVQNGLNQVYQIADFQLITSVDVKAGPTSVRIRFTTKFATIPIVEVFRKLSKHPAMDMVVANRVAEAFPVFGGNQTNHDIRLGGLDQDSIFWFRITAFGGTIDSPSIITDDFVTGRRRATLFIDEIKVFNSGDPGGTGEMVFELGVYDMEKEVLLGNQHVHPASGNEEDVESGSSIGLPFGSPVEVINKAPDRIGIFVDGWDTDYNPFGPEWGLHARGQVLPTDSVPGDGHGEDDYYTWAALTLPVDLPDFPTSIPLDIDPGNWGVHFTFLGRIDVQILVPMEIHQPASTFDPATDSERPEIVTHMGRTIWVGDVKTGVQGVLLGPEGKVRRMIPKPHPKHPGFPELIREEMGGPRFPLGFTVVSLPRGQVDLFGRAANGRIAHASWNTKEKGGRVEWSDLGGQISSDIAVVRSGDAFDLFGIGTNGAAYHAKIDNRGSGNRKTKWESLGGKFVGRLAAAASVRGPLHLFGVNEDGAAFYSPLSRDGRNGSGKWTSLGGKFAGSIVAESTAKGVVVFAVDSDRVLFGKSWDGRKWNPSGGKWLPLGGIDCFSVPRKIKSQAKTKSRKKK